MKKKSDGTTLLQESEYDAVADIKRIRYSIFCAPFTVSNAVGYNASGTGVQGYEFSSSPYVLYYPSWAIIWYIGFGENGTADDNLLWYASSSTHELYLTYNGHISSYETVFHVSCTGAHGLASETNIVNAIFTNSFTSTHLKRKGANEELKYYGCFSSNNVLYFQSTPFQQGSGKLLKYQDGRCGDWANFLKEMYQIQGINTVAMTIKPESQINNSSMSSDGFIVKNIRFPENPDFPGVYPYVCQQWMLECEGIKGQGEMNTPRAKIFDNHAVIRYNDRTFDPSYGMIYNTATFCSDFESMALDAYVQKSSDGLNCAKTNVDNVIGIVQ